MVKIGISESQYNMLLNEYHSQQRLPFKVNSMKFSDGSYGEMIDDEFYSKKNQAEQYLDWLEEFGRYGVIGNSSLKFDDCIIGGIKSCINNSRISIDYDINDDVDVIGHIKGILMHRFKYIKFDSRGNIYVERAVKLGDDISDVVNDLFSSLSDSYGNNVGGCWSFKEGNGYAYCSNQSGSLVLLKGYIRLEDIDWMKTCDLNYHYDEYEIRVNPNAKVELFEVIVDNKYRLPLYSTLVVTSSYFGNNSKYKGNFATIDDGMGGRRLIDRNGNINNSYGVKSFERVFGDCYIVRKTDGKCILIDEDGNKLIDDEYDGMNGFKDGFIHVFNFDSGHNLMDSGFNLFSDEFVDEITDITDGIVAFIKDKKYKLYRYNGKLVTNDIYDYAEGIDYGLIRVDINTMINYLRKDGSYLSDTWFETGSLFYDGGIAIVGIMRDDFQRRRNFLDLNGRILYPDKWFELIRKINIDYDKMYKVRYNGVGYFADMNGNVDFSHGFEWW